MWSLEELKVILNSFPPYVDAKIKLMDKELTMREYKELILFITDFETKYYNFVERIDN